MESFNKNWKPILAGGLAIGAAALAYSYMNSKEHAMVQDI